MPDISVVLAGLGDAFSLFNLAFVVLGVVVGLFVGAVPGIGPVMAMAIAIPFTLGLDPLPGIAFLIGVNKGGLVGGAIPAVLMNTHPAQRMRLPPRLTGIHWPKTASRSRPQKWRCSRLSVVICSAIWCC